MKNRSFFQHVWDALGAPLRLLFLPDRWVIGLHLTTKQQERISATLPHIVGRLLDIGAGENRLVAQYRNGIGIDVIDWGSGARIIESCRQLPFQDESFDTVTFLACLNHIPERYQALVETRRVLKPDGRVIITMIGPFLGTIGHRFWHYGGARHRLTQDNELPGLSSSAIWELLKKTGFIPGFQKKFLYGLNNLFVAYKNHPDAAKSGEG